MSAIISFVIPLYNREKTIGETLESVLNQTSFSWEVIIVDDGSDDRSTEICTMFTRKDARFKFFRRETQEKGGNVCRNIGMKKAAGDYVVFLDSDDLIVPSFVKERLNTAYLKDGCDFWVFPGAVFFEDKKQPHYYWNIANENIGDIERFLNFDSPWQTTGVLWRKSFLNRNNLVWDESLGIWQDIDFHLSALLKRPNYKIYWEKDFDYLVRADSPDSLSRSNYYTDLKVNSRLLFWKKYFLLLQPGGVPAQNLRSLLLIVLKSLHVKKNMEGLKQVLKEAEKENVISSAEKRLILRRSLLNRLGRLLKLDFLFPGEKVQSVFKSRQAYTLQCIPVRETVKI